MLLSGAITAFALMVVIGLVYGANRFTSAADAASAPLTAPALQGNQAGNSTDVTELQQQVQTLKSELDKAYSDLQTAYNQISVLQSQASTGGRFGGERESRGAQQFPFFGGDD
jgi:TolA-binding protein